MSWWAWWLLAAAVCGGFGLGTWRRERALNEAWDDGYDQAEKDLEVMPHAVPDREIPADGAQVDLPRPGGQGFVHQVRDADPAPETDEQPPSAAGPGQPAVLTLTLAPDLWAEPDLGAWADTLASMPHVRSDDALLAALPDSRPVQEARALPGVRDADVRRGDPGPSGDARLARLGRPRLAVTGPAARRARKRANRQASLRVIPVPDPAAPDFWAQMGVLRDEARLSLRVAGIIWAGWQAAA